jgi:hypothetical protein
MNFVLVFEEREKNSANFEHYDQGCHTGRPEAFWRAYRAGRRAALSIMPYMNRVGYYRQRNYCSKFTLLQ